MSAVCFRWLIAGAFIFHFVLHFGIIFSAIYSIYDDTLDESSKAINRQFTLMMFDNALGHNSGIGRISPYTSTQQHQRQNTKESGIGFHSFAFPKPIEPDNNNNNINNVKRDDCDVFLDTIETIHPDPLLLDMIHEQQKECGAYTSKDWRDLRNIAAESVRQREAVMYFAHISKTGGTVITDTLRKGGIRIPNRGKSNAQIDGFGPQIPNWPFMSTEQQRKVIREWHDLPGDYGSREFGLTRSNMLCPGKDIAYFGTIRHPFRRIKSLVTKWAGIVKPETMLNPNKLTESGKHKVRDHTVAWYAGFSHDGGVYVPMNQTTLNMAKWRWCAMFSGSIAVDDNAAQDWHDLIYTKFDVPSKLFNCTGMQEGSGPNAVRQQCPGIDPKAESWIDSLSLRERESVTLHNEWDIAFWDFQLKTRHSRNTE